MDYNYFKAVCDDVREVIAESWGRIGSLILKPLTSCAKR